MTALHPDATTYPRLNPEDLAKPGPTPDPMDPADAALLWLARARDAWLAKEYRAAETAAKIADVWQYRSERHAVELAFDPVPSWITGVVDWTGQPVEMRADDPRVADDEALIEAVRERSAFEREVDTAVARLDGILEQAACRSGVACRCHDDSDAALGVAPGEGEPGTITAGPDAAYLAGVRISPAADVVPLPELVERHGDLIEHTAGAR